MSEASITALALEESLLREWSEFHSRVELRRAPPGTRDEADGFSDYSRKDGFVDSVVDALSLYLADRNEFDVKFGAYLDLMLIQRARPDDIEILKKLAAKYAAAQDLVSLTGLLHRLQMYSGDARLAEPIAICMTALDQVKNVDHLDAWARSIGIYPGGASWSFGLKLGTAPPNFWLVRKSELQSRDVSVDLLVNESQWRVQVARVDREYSAQWRPSGITVDTDVTKLKALAAWPKLITPQLLPTFTANLGRFLGVEWLRMAWLTTSGAGFDRAKLLAWLHSTVDEIGP